MIETSNEYKTLFQNGAIQEYKVVIGGVEHSNDIIYDAPTIEHNLFDSQRLTIGSLTSAQFKAKLRVPSENITSGDSVEFFYRYTDGEQYSEWIKKFKGNVTKRNSFDDEVTNVEAMDKAANYERAIDIIEVSEYPANAIDITNQLATHLGLTVEGNIINQNIVEYPNELTIVQVLQLIAKSSGGNFTITPDDKLRLVGFDGEATESFSAQSIESQNTFDPISKIRVYHKDEQAFESGDDTGSILEIDNQWGTQSSTDYILTVLNGYQYRPHSGEKVYLDPAYELGDYFEYNDGAIQLVANTVWTFDGGCTVDVRTPQNNDKGLDDPYEVISSQPLKKKVTLGDAYQGVTISRDKGIEMLLSPDGTLNHAIGRFYADLTRGLAFQYRDTAEDTWRDWLYFDKSENVFKLSLYNTSQEVDAKIQLGVENVHNGNLIYGINGNNAYTGWDGGSKLLFVPGLKFIKDMKYSHGFQILENDTSLSGRTISFFSGGYDISPIARILPDKEYSFKGVVLKYASFNIDLLEYDSGMTLIKTTKYQGTNTPTFEFTKMPESGTMYARLKFNRTGVTPSNRLEFTDMMFNRGTPQDWFASVNDAMAHSVATLDILSNEIVLKVDADGRMVQQKLGVDEKGSYYRIKADEITLEGFTTINGAFKIDLQGNLTANNAILNDVNITGGTLKVGSNFNVASNGNVTMNNATMSNATITGNLNAGKIANMNFDSTGITFPNSKVKLDSSINGIRFGAFNLRHGLFKDQGGSNTIDGMSFYQNNTKVAGGIYVQGSNAVLEVGTIHAKIIGDMFGAPTLISNATFDIGLNNREVYLTVDGNGFVKAVNA